MTKWGFGVRSAHHRTSSASYLAASSVLHVRAKGRWSPVVKFLEGFRRENTEELITENLYRWCVPHMSIYKMSCQIRTSLVAPQPFVVYSGCCVTRVTLNGDQQWCTIRSWVRRRPKRCSGCAHIYIIFLSSRRRRRSHDVM